MVIWRRGLGLKFHPNLGRLTILAFTHMLQMLTRDEEKNIDLTRMPQVVSRLVNKRGNVVVVNSE